MFLLSLLLPGKAAKFARKCLWPIFGLVLLYLALYIYTLKSLDFQTNNYFLRGKDVNFNLKVTNNSIFMVEIISLGFETADKKKFMATSNDLPCKIPRESSQELKMTLVNRPFEKSI